MPQHNTNHVYPHQSAEGIVTRENLASDFQDHPEAYHTGLHEHIRAHLGVEALENSDLVESTNNQQNESAESLWAKIVDANSEGLPHSISETDMDILIDADYGEYLPSQFEHLEAGADIHGISNRLVEKLLDKEWGIYELGMQDGFSNLKGISSKNACRIIDNDYPEYVLQFPGAFEVFDGEVFRKLLDADGLPYENLLDRLHLFSGIAEKDLEQLRLMTDRPWLTEFPRWAESIDSKGNKTQHPASQNAKDSWFADMSFAYMEGGFTRTTIGRLIRLRVEAGESIHDASQWLSVFLVPEKIPDIATIMHLRDEEGFDPEIIPEVVLCDIDTEQLLFEKLASMSMTERQRVNLSNKQATIELMFSDPVGQLLYAELIASHGGVPYYKTEDFNLNDLMQSAILSAHDFVQETAFGHNKAGERTTHNTDVSTIEQILSENPWVDAEPSEIPEKVYIILQKLKQAGISRREYIRETEQWLLRHADSPSSRLRKVWHDRPAALAAGVEDNAASIELWQKTGAWEAEAEHLDATNLLYDYYGLTKQEMLEDEEIIRQKNELLRVLSVSDTIRAVSHLKSLKQQRDWEEKLLNSFKAELEVENHSKNKIKYTFEILDKDDPRGYTIGEDTDCCMTIDGESESCITTGYAENNAGFMALYGKKDKLVAQSFWYVNPEHPTVLVVDNIETTKGKDTNTIIEAYRTALRQYFESNGSLITEVHVGTGFSDVSLKSLEPADSIPPLNEDIYTDAHHQKILLRVDKT